MNSYIFVVSAVVSIFSVYYVLIHLLKKMKTGNIPFETIQKQFLLGIFMSKIIPFIFIVFGIIKMTPKTINDLYIPWIIIGLTIIIGLILLNNTKNRIINEPMEKSMSYLVMFTRPLMLTMPIMAAAFLYLMTFA